MQPDITLTFTIYEKVAAYERLLKEARWQVTQAQTSDERLEALIWVDNAERNLARCRRELERQQ